MTDTSDVPPIEPRSKHWIVDAIAILFVVLIALKFTWHADLGRDLIPADECGYILSGFDLERVGPPGASFSPLYTIWYYCLSLIQPDAGILELWSWRTLIVLLAVLIYAIARRGSAPTSIALLASCWFISSNSMAVWPYPTFFATTVGGIGCLLAMFARSVYYQLAILGGTLGVMAFARPEMQVAQLAFLGAFGLFMVVAYFRSQLSIPNAIASLAICLLPVTLLTLTFGSPIAPEPTAGLGVTVNSRSSVAFGQHYSVNKSEVGAVTVNPWLHWESIVTKDFGKACGPLEAFFRNPGALMWHVQRNVTRSAWNLRYLMLPILPNTIRDSLITLALSLLVVAAMGVVLGRMGHRFGIRRDGLLVPTCMILAIAVPISISCALIYPRDHYLFPLTFFLVVFAAILIGPLVRFTATYPSRPLATVAFGLTLLMVMPNVVHRWSVMPMLTWQNNSETPHKYRRIISAVQTIPVQGTVRIVEPGYSVFRMAYPKLVAYSLSLWEIEKAPSFASFMKTNDVNVVIINGDLEACGWIANDKTYQQFRDSTPDNFLEWYVEDSGTRILIRRDALSSDISPTLLANQKTRSIK